MKIVAVDDNGEHARTFIDRVLQLHGAKVASVDSAAKAIEAVRQFHPDIVLCDLMMPEMDGFALSSSDPDAWMTRWLGQSRWSRLTAFAGAENRLKTEQAGFQVHLDKPIDPPPIDRRH